MKSKPSISFHDPRHKNNFGYATWPAAEEGRAKDKGDNSTDLMNLFLERVAIL